MLTALAAAPEATRRRSGRSRRLFTTRLATGKLPSRRARERNDTKCVAWMQRVNAKYKSSLLFIDETRVPLTAPAFP